MEDDQAGQEMAGEEEIHLTIEIKLNYALTESSDEFGHWILFYR